MDAVRRKSISARGTDVFEAYREGTISFDVFSRALASDWRRLAKYVLRRWQIPVGVLSEEDLVQEMQLAAWRAFHTYDPAKGTRLRSFVMWTAVDRAKKFLHVQRKAQRRSERAPSRILIPISSLSRDGEDPIDLSDLLPVDGYQEERTEAARLLASIAPKLLPPLRKFLEEGSIGGAAWELLADLEAARECGVSTHDEAVGMVEDAIGALVDGSAAELLESQRLREQYGLRSLSDARRSLAAVF